MYSKLALFLLTLCCCHALSADPMQLRQIDPAALSDLAAFWGLSQDANIVDETQKRWLCRRNTERWEMSELSPEQRAFVLRWATEQGLYAPWFPSLDTYDKALILGATTGCMQRRLDFLKALWEKGTRFHEVIWLTGDRPLDPRIDDLLERCQTESEAARILWEETILPEEMRQLPVVFIALPMKERRPNTRDTIEAWVNYESSPCTALFVSDQPFCGYQYAVINSTLPPSFSFDVVGNGVDPTPHPAAGAITLDSIARWLYEEHAKNIDKK